MRLVFVCSVLALMGSFCSRKNEDPVPEVGNMCQGANSIEGEWYLRDVTLDEHGGADLVTEEDGSIIFGCNGTYTKKFSFTLEHQTIEVNKKGKWTSDVDDQVVFDELITFTRTRAGKSTSWLTEDYDSSSTLSSETTQLLFVKK